MCGHPGCFPQMSHGLSRRELMKIGTVAGLFSALPVAGPHFASAQQVPGAGRVLLKGGTVITMDRSLGDFASADVLIEGARISAIGPNLQVTGAEVIDCGNMIVMPGFVDTHRHMWEGQLRQLNPDMTLIEYLINVHGRYGPIYRPQDAYVGNLLSAVSALDAGVTTLMDWSHLQITPEHTDALIKGLQDSGVRAVFGYGVPQASGHYWEDTTRHKYPGDIKRLRSQYFNSDDQLLTLALAASGDFHGDVAKQEWTAARDVGARITTHSHNIFEKSPIIRLSKDIKLSDDTTYVHCVGWSDTEWKMVADSGGTISLAPATEIIMGIFNPPIQRALDAGIRPSLSGDAETNAPNDMFTQMRITLASHNADILTRGERGEKNLPKRLTVRDVLEFATVEGAKANGLASKVGSLSPGKQADVVCLRKDRINVMPVTNPVGAVVLGMDTSNVDTVFVAGKAKKRGGQLLGVDLKRLAADASASRDYLDKTVPSMPVGLPLGPLPGGAAGGPPSQR